MSSLLNRFVSEERGAVAVIVAIAFPVFLLAGVLAVDVSHWNVVKRELQTQADAGALAGGAAWQFPCNSTIESTILSNAQQYAGDATYPGTPQNHSFKDLPDSDHHVLYNSTLFYPNRTKPDAGAPALTGHPCADNAIDVKVTQANVPAFFGINFLARHIDASARAQLKEAAGITGLLPLAVPDPSTVQKAWIQFYDEASGANVGSPVALSANGSANNMALYSTAATTVNVTTDKLGVRAIISGINDNNCADDGVECYDQTSSSTTLDSVRRWPTTDPDAAATQPQPWVSDLPIGLDTGASACTAPYFANIPLSTATCTMKVFATVHFSTKSGTGVTDLASQGVSATVGGTTVNLTPPANTNPATSNNIWTGAIPVAVSSGSSQLSLTLDQRQGSVHGTGCKANNGNNSPCKITISDAQRVYGASALTSGPIGLVQIDEINGSGQLSTYANSIPKCTSSPCNHNFIVTIGISTLHVATAGETPTVLRLLFNQQNSSQNQSLVCDPNNRNLVNELTNGCSGDFRIAEPNECDGVQHQNDLPQPWPCVEIKGGEQPNAVSQAMKARIMGGANSCTSVNANHWSTFPNLPTNDNRIVPLFLTTFGAFEGSGKKTVPIVSFAEFYITGWTTQGGGGQPSGCNNDPVPTDTKGGYLVGHFIKRVIPNTSGDNGQDCIPTDLSPCTAVLTK